MLFQEFAYLCSYLSLTQSRMQPFLFLFWHIFNLTRTFHRKKFYKKTKKILVFYLSFTFVFLPKVIFLYMKELLCYIADFLSTFVFVRLSVCLFVCYLLLSITTLLWILHNTISLCFFGAGFLLPLEWDPDQEDKMIRGSGSRRLGTMARFSLSCVKQTYYENNVHFFSRQRSVCFHTYMRKMF